MSVRASARGTLAAQPLVSVVDLAGRADGDSLELAQPLPQVQQARGVGLADALGVALPGLELGQRNGRRRPGRFGHCQSSSR